MLRTEILEKLQIDECDMALFNSYSWYVSSNGKYPYLITPIKLPDGRQATKYFHRMIMDAPPGVEVDHISGDTCDYRHINLRLCTHAQNQQNQRKTKRATSSIYKGVYWNKDREKWLAQIVVNGKKKHLSYFQDEIAAACAYDAAAIELFQDFANLNFPQKG
jgi:hypothetical protein